MSAGMTQPIRIPAKTRSATATANATPMAAQERAVIAGPLSPERP
jgi:hypothetical protein